MRHWVILSDVEEQHREISQEIAELRAEIALPPSAPAPVHDTPRIEEDFDTDMGEEDGDLSSDGMDPQDHIPLEEQDDGAGAGFATSAQNPRKRVKKGGLKQKENSRAS